MVDRMTKAKKTKAAKIGTEFDEVVARLLQTDKEELEGEIERTKREADEAGQYVEERRDSIRRGARRTKHRFRL
jgi:hypothetical protein